MSQYPAARRTVASPSATIKPKAGARRAQLSRHAGRRRPIDPPVAEPGPGNPEVEFMQAMQDYKQSSGRMFPTWSEVLEVLKALGYTKPV